MPLSSRGTPTSLLAVTGLLCVGVVSLMSVSIPGRSVFREVTLRDLLVGATPVDLPSLAYGGGLFFIGFAATVIGLVLLMARAH
ncbi:MAG: hypothetical protein ABEH58_06975 [Haloplanus sp.]